MKFSVEVKTIWYSYIRIEVYAMNDENSQVEINKKNKEDFENLMKESSINKDGYWDKKNPIVKFILTILGLAIIVGAIYYITIYFLNK